MTPAIKDQILKDIMDAQQERISVNEKVWCEKYCTSPYMLNLALQQFEDMGLLKLNSTKTSTDILLKMAAIDFVRRGGFIVAEEIITASLEKLQLEIESLQKTFPERANTWLSMAANIATISAAFQLGK